MEFVSENIDLNNQEIVSIIDDVPFWSAPFGLRLLDTVRFRQNINILDIGSGTGFPLLELAQRFGDSCKVYGIDPWETASDRTMKKVKIYGINNVQLFSGKAEKMPFEDEFFSLITSNNGLNNVEDEEQVLLECYRVATAESQLVMTYNLPGTMREFYRNFEILLKELGKTDEIQKLKAHIYEKRKPLIATLNLLEKTGFKVVNVIEDKFNLRYIDGTTMLKHFFIRLAFMEPWKMILKPEDVSYVFGLLEKVLNQSAQEHGELAYSIPFVCINCIKKS